VEKTLSFKYSVRHIGNICEKSKIKNLLNRRRFMGWSINECLGYGYMPSAPTSLRPRHIQLQATFNSLRRFILVCVLLKHRSVNADRVICFETNTGLCPPLVSIGSADRMIQQHKLRLRSVCGALHIRHRLLKLNLLSSSDIQIILIN
jgi:hypothetical protein